ncbi:MAG: MBL fold metallo-hydrolase [Fimbriimonadales bacterium]
MKILLTGTGGADGIPAFCAESELSDYARTHGGHDVRSRAAAVVDGVLRLDFGPDTFAQVQRLGLHVRDWRAVLFTHSHDDHFSPRELQYMFPPFVNGTYVTPTIYGNQTILDGISGAFDEANQLSTQLIRSFEPTELLGYTLTPIAAYHKLDEDSMNFIIQKDKTLLYATDTGVWREETWDFLKGQRFDAVVIECTDGFNPSEYWGHLSCDELVQVVSRLREMGCLGPETPIRTTHHAASGRATHAQLTEWLAPHGIIPGHDGMLLEF